MSEWMRTNEMRVSCVNRNGMVNVYDMMPARKGLDRNREVNM